MRLPQIEPLLTPRQVAAILELTPKTLKNWRCLGKGPAWRKLPGTNRIRYDQQDVRLFLAQQC
jgi:hypothetical protein